jgi:hypothetical protein
MVSDSNYQTVSFTHEITNNKLVKAHALVVTNLDPATIYKYQVTSGNGNGTAVDSGLFITQSASSGKTDVYFNHSVDNSVSTGENALGNQNFANLLIDRINQTNFSIDIALFQFSYYANIAAALINAKNRGAKIRFIYNHSVNTPEIDSLIAHGIPILKRNYDTTHSMHNKFIIFDYRGNSNPASMYLWTGSANVSHPQFHSDRNNIIVIQDESLCAVYTREFEEMWGSHGNLPDSSKAKFGDQKVDNVPHILNVAGTRMEVYFAPSDDVSGSLTRMIKKKTTNSLFFCMLKFELPVMEDTLHAIFNQGISLKGVFDSVNSTLPGSAFPRMKGQPVENRWDPPADVYLDTIPGLIHHKYFITDATSATGNRIISTGSYNWELPADLYNDDNSLTIFNDRVNNLYFQEFHMRYRESGGEYLTFAINEKASAGSDILCNYPNPFHRSTTIKYKVIKPGTVSLSIYDESGRRLETLVNKWQTIGTYIVNWDVGTSKSGAYFCRLTNHFETSIIKINLIK